MNLQPLPPPAAMRKAAWEVLMAERGPKIAAMDALIDATLAGAVHFPDVLSAQTLLNLLQSSGVADLSEHAGHAFVTVYGITACSNGTSERILRSWQHSARYRLAKAGRK
jgi:hypothetical protein